MENYINSGYERKRDTGQLFGFAESLTYRDDVISIQTTRQGRNLLSCIEVIGKGNELVLRIKRPAPAWCSALPDWVAVPVQQLAVMAFYRPSLGPVETGDMSYLLRTAWMQVVRQLRSILFDPCRKFKRKCRRMIRRMQLLMHSIECNL